MYTGRALILSGLRSKLQFRQLLVLPPPTPTPPPTGGPAPTTWNICLLQSDLFLFLQLSSGAKPLKPESSGQEAAVSGSGFSGSLSATSCPVLSPNPVERRLIGSWERVTGVPELRFRCTKLPGAAAKRAGLGRSEALYALNARQRNANEGAAQVRLLFPVLPVELQAGKHVSIQDE